MSSLVGVLRRSGERKRGFCFKHHVSAAAHDCGQGLGAVSILHPREAGMRDLKPLVAFSIGSRGLSQTFRDALQILCFTTRSDHWTLLEISNVVSETGKE